MEQNPYESPQEADYKPPSALANPSWIRDRVKLLIAAHLWSVPLFVVPTWIWLWITM